MLLLVSILWNDLRSVFADKLTDGAVYYVTHVIDGDTFKVSEKGYEYTLRMLGIDTPELSNKYGEKDCYATTSKHALERLIRKKNVSIRFSKTKENKDRYGRYLAYVYLKDSELFINQYMIAEGLARTMIIGTRHEMADQFQATQEQAKQARMGMWKACY